MSKMNSEITYVRTARTAVCVWAGVWACVYVCVFGEQ